MSYYKRTADALLQDLLDAFGAVLIEGPKCFLQSYYKKVKCGKI
ncbi:hypothetical protein [Alistipes finegoldii]|nr:hypothetical protein [Alistipes finegoldii]